MNFALSRFKLVHTFARMVVASFVIQRHDLLGAGIKLYIIDYTDTLLNKVGCRASYIDLSSLQHPGEAVPRPVLQSISPGVGHAKVDAISMRKEKKRLVRTHDLLGAEKFVTAGDISAPVGCWLPCKRKEKRRGRGTRMRLTLRSFGSLYATSKDSWPS